MPAEKPNGQTVEPAIKHGSSAGSGTTEQKSIVDDRVDEFLPHPPF